MKNKVEIQRTWESDWFNPLAESESLSFESATQIKVELRKEVFWLVTLPADVDMGEALSIRSGKIQAIMDANDGSASSFDVFYVYRKAFFEWVLI